MTPQAAETPVAGLPLLALCIPTFRRNTLLRECLQAAAALVPPPGHRVEIFIADNDGAGGARSVVEALRPDLPFPLHYLVEPARGLSAVRNRLLDAAVERGAEHIAFLDDDERPEPAWLECLAAGLQTRAADVATGPVTSMGESGTVLSTGRDQPSGSEPRHVACNNVLFMGKLAAEQGLRFDRRFDFVGGEDFDFFERSRQLGNRHAWIAEARVIETLPAERLTARYLAWRHYSGAASSVMRFRKHHPAMHTWAHFGLKAAGKGLGAVYALVAALFTLDRRRVRTAMKRACNGAGYLAALLNLRIERYS